MFVMYFSGRSSEDNSKHCVGTATSSSITGPYTTNEDPLSCPLSQGGAIDASGFTDPDGTRYVVYKIDGNSLNGDGTQHPTPIMLQRLSSDAVTPDGEAIQILDHDEIDGGLVEAPSLVLVDGMYYLTFSSNVYSTLKYDTSYATASAISGPYTKVQAPDAPLLVSGDPSSSGPLGGPGGADFWTRAGLRSTPLMTGRVSRVGAGCGLLGLRLGMGRLRSSRLKWSYCCLYSSIKARA